MVFIRAGEGSVDMGIYIRDTPGQSTADFLMPHGVIKQMFTPRIAFYIPGFATKDIIKFVEYYEKVERFEIERGTKLASENAILSRDVSAPLLAPVRKFILDANEIHSQVYTQLTGLYQRLAHETETRRITTQNAARMVFGDNPTDTELYATHLALMGDGLRYLGDKGFHRITSNFRIRSKRELAVIDECTKWVRESSVVFDTKGYGNKAKGPMKEFIEKARTLINRSRILRKKSPQKKGVSVEIEPTDITWTEADQKFIDFAIARLKSYGLQRTPIEGLLPYILRQTRRYEDKTLDGSCAYDFLTEIGAFTPWENFVLHQENQKLPGYNVSRQADEDEARIVTINDAKFSDLGLKDSLKDIRKNWGNMRVFCVDDATAEEIDDGISVEKVSENETWVHVHIANPTAFLTPDHWISKIAEERAITKYFDPHVFRMLPRPISNSLGVANGAPVFTFSTKIDNNGEILDINIQPGTVHNVKKITYNQLEMILNLTSVPIRSFYLGALPPSPPEPEANLTPGDLEALQHLHKCSHALLKRRVRNGMISLRNVYHSYHLSPEVTKYSAASKVRSSMPQLFRGFPSMRLDVETEPQTFGKNDFIAEFMILANTAIAQYATKYNIPLPFRTLTYNTERTEIVSYFKDVIMPTRDEFGVAEKGVMDDLNVYMKVGFAQLLPHAGPHIMLGLPQGYTKATSPLRRYSDMLAHWNLQSHLLHKPLTFDEQTMAALLAKIDIRERMANFGASETRRFWATMVITRILERGQKGQFPETMTMTVLEPKLWPELSVGFVQELAVVGKVAFPDSKSVVKLKAGDKVSVRLAGARPGDRTVLFETDGEVEPSGVVV